MVEGRGSGPVEGEGVLGSRKGCRGVESLTVLVTAMLVLLSSVLGPSSGDILSSNEEENHNIMHRMIERQVRGCH